MPCFLIDLKVTGSIENGTLSACTTEAEIRSCRGLVAIPFHISIRVPVQSRLEHNRSILSRGAT